MATIYKRGRIYWIAYRDRNGRRVQTSTKQTDERAARVLKRHYDAVEKSYQLHGTPLQSAIRFSTWRAEYQQRRTGRVARKTLDRDRQALDSLQAFLGGDRYLNQIAHADIERWYSNVLQNRAVATANCLYRHVKTFFRAAAADRYLAESPCQVRQVREVERVVRVLTKAEVGRLLSTIPAPWASAARVALYTGARAGEICRLRVMDIGLDACPAVATIHSTTDNPTKSRKFRVVPIPDKSVPFFQDITTGRPPGDHLLLNASGAPWRVMWLAKGFSRWARRADVDCSFHDLRRTYGAWLVMAGADLPTVQLNLGHHDISTTIKHYSHLVISHRADQTNRLPEV